MNRLTKDELEKKAEMMICTAVGRYEIDDFAQDVIEYLKSQPQESQQWIPVNVQLPRQEDIPYDCLVVSNGFVCEASFLDRDAVHRWCASGAGWLRTDDVTHWRPKPAPPKGGSHEYNRR